MADYYSLSIAIKTYLMKEEVVKQIINEAMSLGCSFNTDTSINVDVNTAVNFITQTNEDELHLIYVQYQDTIFTLRFMLHFSQYLYISIDPPNSSWRLCTEKLHWIDNARYARLLLLLCKNLPIVNFDIESDYYQASKPEDHNTINISAGFDSYYNQDQNVMHLLINLYQYNLPQNTNIKGVLSKALQTGESYLIILEKNDYKISMYLQEYKIYFKALEPFKTQLIDQTTYKDLPFYMTVALNVTAGFPILTLASNFEDS